MKFPKWNFMSFQNHLQQTHKNQKQNSLVKMLAPKIGFQDGAGLRVQHVDRKAGLRLRPVRHRQISFLTVGSWMVKWAVRNMESMGKNASNLGMGICYIKDHMQCMQSYTCD